MRLLSATAFLALLPRRLCRGRRRRCLPRMQVDIPLGRRRLARAALQARRRRPVSDRDRAARLRRAGRAFRAGAAALSRLGRAIAEARQCGAAAGQLWFARTRPAMPGQGTPRARPPRTGRGHPGIPAMAGAAALGRRTTASACWDGRTAPARCCGRYVRNCRRAVSSRISARRLRFIRTAGVSSGLGWSARVPTLLLIGAKDDVSSPPACRQMIDGARGRSALARIVVYPERLSRFRPRQFAAACAGRDIRRGRAGARPSRHRHRGARRFAKARRRMAGAVSDRPPHSGLSLA